MYAWKAVPAETIQNCWRHVELVDSKTLPVDNEESDSMEMDL
jgi:hypothetical protein